MLRRVFGTRKHNIFTFERIVNTVTKTWSAELVVDYFFLSAINLEIGLATDEESREDARDWIIESRVAGDSTNGGCSSCV